MGGQELQLFSGVRPGAEVDVVGAQRDPGELRVAEGVLYGQPATGENPDTAGALGAAQPRAAAWSASVDDAGRGSSS